MAIPGAKSLSPPPLHAPMPPPIEGAAERRQWGVGHPLTKPPHHRLHVVSRGLVVGCMGTCMESASKPTMPWL